MSEIQEHYAAILADLESERDGLTKAIEVIRRKMGLAPEEGSPAQARMRIAALDEGPSNGSAPAVRSDDFFQLSASQAAQKYLGKVKRPATAKELTDALVAGGFTTKSDNVYSTVFTALRRNPDIFANLGRA